MSERMNQGQNGRTNKYMDKTSLYSDDQCQILDNIDLISLSSLGWSPSQAFITFISIQLTWLSSQHY